MTKDDTKEFDEVRYLIADAMTNYMDTHENFSSHVMALALLSMSQGLYRTTDNMSKKAFMKCAETSWDFMDTHGDFS